jgi:LysR family glycine cleavage system transcriptional activator
MQMPSRLPSLNAVRVFEAAARLGSLKLAGEELGVTASAVSHQVRQLEESLGVRLFARSNNAIQLTAEGERFLAATTPALATIAAAASSLHRDANEVFVRASVSLALRWLIPRLGRFNAAHPSIRVRLETPVSAMADHDDIDIVIGYSRGGALVPGATVLFEDICVAVASPAIAVRHAGNAADVMAASVSVISSTQDDWDWRKWAGHFGVDWRRLRIANRFDTDDASWEASAAGLGLALASPRLIERELRNGLLAIAGPEEGVHFGHYWVRARPPMRRGAELFLAWLLAMAGEAA